MKTKSVLMSFIISLLSIVIVNAQLMITNSKFYLNFYNNINKSYVEKIYAFSSIEKKDIDTAEFSFLKKYDVFFYMPSDSLVLYQKIDSEKFGIDWVTVLWSYYINTQDTLEVYYYKVSRNFYALDNILYEYSQFPHTFYATTLLINTPKYNNKIKILIKDKKNTYIYNYISDDKGKIYISNDIEKKYKKIVVEAIDNKHAFFFKKSIIDNNIIEPKNDFSSHIESALKDYKSLRWNLLGE